MAKALVTWGGWDGHEPDKVAALFAGWLREAGMAVESGRFSRARGSGGWIMPRCSSFPRSKPCFAKTGSASPKWVAGCRRL